MIHTYFSQTYYLWIYWGHFHWFSPALVHLVCWYRLLAPPSWNWRVWCYLWCLQHAWHYCGRRHQNSPPALHPAGFKISLRTSWLGGEKGTQRPRPPYLPLGCKISGANHSWPEIPLVCPGECEQCHWTWTDPLSSCGFAAHIHCSLKSCLWTSPWLCLEPLWTTMESQRHSVSIVILFYFYFAVSFLFLFISNVLVFIYLFLPFLSVIITLI